MLVTIPSPKTQELLTAPLLITPNLTDTFLLDMILNKVQCAWLSLTCTSVQSVLLAPRSLKLFHVISLESEYAVLNPSSDRARSERWRGPHLFLYPGALFRNPPPSFLFPEKNKNKYTLQVRAVCPHLQAAGQCQASRNGTTQLVEVQVQNLHGGRGARYASNWRALVFKPEFQETKTLSGSRGSSCLMSQGFALTA